MVSYADCGVVEMAVLFKIGCLKMRIGGVCKNFMTFSMRATLLRAVLVSHMLRISGISPLSNMLLFCSAINTLHTIYFCHIAVDFFLGG